MDTFGVNIHGGDVQMLLIVDAGLPDFVGEGDDHRPAAGRWLLRRDESALGNSGLQVSLVADDHFGGHAYDAIMLLKKAMEQAGFSPAAIRDQLEKTTKVAGIGGTFSFSPQDHAGLNSDAFVLVQVEKGDWKLIK